MSWSIWLFDPTKDEDDHHRELHYVNHTHNCNQMVRDAGIPDWPYDFLDRIQAEGTARDMITPLTHAVRELIVNAPVYEKMNPKNGWGSRQSLVNALSELLGACTLHPSAKVEHFS